MRKYIPFFKAGMMEELSYKAAIFMWMVITVLQLICIVFLWIAVFQSASEPVVNGFTFEQMIVYFVMTNIFAFTCLDSPTLHDINTEIKDGTIAISFIKPISYRLRFLSRSLGGCCMRTIILGIPAYTIAYIVFVFLGYITIVSAAALLVHIVLFLLCTLFAVALYDTINYICGVLCFYTTAAWGLNQMKNVVINFFSGVLIPLSFFPGSFGKIVEVLPFAGLTQNPVYILIQRVDVMTAVGFVAKNIVWLVIFEIVAKLLFMHASKKVTVQGG